jgi:hypothetical protein
MELTISIIGIVISFFEKFRQIGCTQKFPDWPPGARTANGTALWL